jgi:hypothetical protein
LVLDSQTGLFQLPCHLHANFVFHMQCLSHQRPMDPLSERGPAPASRNVSYPFFKVKYTQESQGYADVFETCFFGNESRRRMSLRSRPTTHRESVVPHLSMHHRPSPTDCSCGSTDELILWEKQHRDHPETLRLLRNREDSRTDGSGL